MEIDDVIQHVRLMGLRVSIRASKYPMAVDTED